MNQKNQPIQLSLSISEINQILESLGELPFIKVYQIIDKIQHQTQAQLHQPMFENTGNNNQEPNTVID